MVSTTNPSDGRARFSRDLVASDKRWVWLKNTEGRHHIARSNYEPTKEDGLVGQCKKLTKRGRIVSDDETLALAYGWKLKHRPVRQVVRIDALFNGGTKGLFDDVDTIKPIGPTAQKSKPKDQVDSLFEEEAQITFLHKLAQLNSAEEFAEALALLYARDSRGPFELYDLFCEAGWAEGHSYCRKRGYVIKTAHTGFIKGIERGHHTREHHEKYWKHRKFTGSMLDAQAQNAIYILKQGPDKEEVNVDGLFD